MILQYESGQLTREEFYEAVRRPIGFRGDLAEFGGYFADIFSEMPGTIALHAELRRRGFKTYIFSNTNDLAIEHVRRNFPFFRNFDGYVFSYKVKAMKPDARIYEALEKLTGRRGAEILYIDDRPENAAGARASAKCALRWPMCSAGSPPECRTRKSWATIPNSPRKTSARVSPTLLTVNAAS